MAAVWGSTFFLIKDLVTRIGVTDMLAVRFAIATVVLAVAARRRLRMDRATAVRGVIAGAVYGFAQVLQTYGLAHTSASVSGFITGLYVVVTPLLGAAVLKARIPVMTWLAAILATIGLGVLSLHGFQVSLGAALTFGSAVLYAVHILALGRWSRPESALGLAVLQMAVISLICFVAALPGGIDLPSTGPDWASLLYLAVIAGAATMLAQTWAQSVVEPTRAAVVMSMEPVFAAAFAVVFGGESPTVRMVVGGCAIIAAMYLVELGPALRARRLRQRPRPHHEE